MLQKLYEQIDDKVLTPAVRESVEREFASAVESKANIIAEAKIDEMEAELLEQHQQQLNMLNEAAIEYENMLKSQYDDLSNEVEVKLNSHKLELNQKAEQYINEKLENINDVIDLYTSKIVSSLAESIKEDSNDTQLVLKAQAMYEALSKFASLAGYDLGRELNESARTADNNYNERVNELLEENRKLQDQVKSLKNNLVFEQCTSDMSMYQKERMRLGLTGLIDDADEEDLKASLMNLKESYNSESELKFNESIDRSDSVSDLLLKNI